MQHHTRRRHRAIHTEPTAAVVQIDQRPAAFGGNRAHGIFDTLPRLSAIVRENTASETVCLHPYQHGICRTYITHHQREVAFALFDIALIGDGTELAPRRFEDGLCRAMDIALVLQPVTDEFGDSEHA